MKRATFGALLVVFGLILTLFWGCSAGPGLEFWFVDALVKVFPDDPAGTARLDKAVFPAARNSNVSIQLALRAKQPVGDLYVDALALTGPGQPIETARVRWVEYVVVTTNTQNTPEEELLRKAPALFPDALLTEFPITVKKDQTRSVWVTIHVPASQEPGEYKGELRLRQGTEAIATVPYTLVVHKATVATPIPLAVNNYLNLSDYHLEQFHSCTRGSGPWWNLIANYARFWAGYYQTSIGANAVSLAKPELAGGGLRYNFSDFERYVETWEAAGVKGQIDGGNLMERQRRRDATIMTEAWVVEGGKPVLRSIPWNDPRAQQFLNTFLPALYKRLQELGWTKKYVQGIMDEPNQWEIPAFLDAAAKVRKFMPGVRTIEPVGLRQDVGFMKKTVDIWVPLLGTFDEKLDLLQKHISEDNGEIWYYTCLSPRGKYPNRFVDTSLTKVRLLHWINYKWNFT
ncbi:MAG TPA: glycoside hydrolase domain-containing protein, partial [Bryobacteraceae bacterium]|nr:glycoside hydrolase domain-containing protein [Bryobacteraceae bacterium]